MVAATGAFSYQAPGSVSDAVALLRSARAAGERIQVMAGGTDLLVQMQSADPDPRCLLDIKKISALNEVRIGTDEIFVGAAVPGCEINDNAELKRILPGFVEATDLIGSTQIQGRATPCGNLCNASPAGDTIPAMIANAGACVIAGPDGERRMAVEDFVVGVGQNALGAEELLTGVAFPRPGARTADAYLRFIPRTEMDIAVAGAGVSLTLDERGVCTAARVAIGAVAPTALLVPDAAAALVGTSLDEAALQAAGAACTAASSPISDKRGTAAYRRKVVAVLARRAAGAAMERARKE